MLFRFLRPRRDGSVENYGIAARDLLHAMQQFAAKHWADDGGGSFGVWQGGELVARLHTALNLSTAQIEPLWHPVKSPPHGISRSVADPSEN